MKRHAATGLGLLLSALLAAGAALADGGPSAPLPFPLGGSFSLTDQFGHTRSEADPDGYAQLLYFGYANCPGICTTAMPLMAEIADRLARQGLTVRPVMITVDRARDRVGTMAAPLERISPDFVGLTGGEAELAKAYRAFSVDIRQVAEDPRAGPVYAHGSLIYLLDAKGSVLTLLPPVLDPAEAARIVSGYLSPP